MQQKTLNSALKYTCEYDPVRDVLHILLQPERRDADECFFVSLEGQPDIFLRRQRWAFKVTGFSVKPASPRLGTRSPSEAAIIRLADELVSRYAPVADSFPVKKAQRPLGANPYPAWDYDAFQDTLYVDLMPDARCGDYRVVKDQPEVVVRHDPGDDRVLSLFGERITQRLGTDMPTDESLRALASQLIAQYAPRA